MTADAHTSGMRPEEAVEIALESLRASGQRITGARSAVIEALSQLDDHPSAERVYDRVRTLHPTIHRATVYRTLDTLTAFGVVTHVHTGGGATAYHLAPSVASPGHLHAKCHPGRTARRRHSSLWISGLGLGLAATIVLAVGIGAIGVPPATVSKIIGHHLFGTPAEMSWTLAQDSISWQVRLPQVLLGASVAVFVIARAGGRITSLRLLIAGVAVGYALYAATSFLIFASDSAQGLRSVLFWLLGSLGLARWGLPLTSVLVIVCLTVAVLAVWSRRLDALAVGDETAHALGISPTGFRVRLLVVVSLCVGPWWPPPAASVSWVW
nr:iron chelate uptake ABC transporter family permease subunit [Saccharomonospora sp.]